MSMSVPEGWESTARPPRLHKRFEFAQYSDTREFLERLETLSREAEYYPDLNFGRTHVNVSIGPPDDSELGEKELSFARRVDELVT